MHKAMARATYVLGFVILAAPAIASAQSVPAYVNVRSAASGGSGCTPRTIHAVVSSDRQRLYLINGSLEASAGPDVLLAEGRRFCQISIDLEYPSDFSYAVSNPMPHRGTVSLEDGVTATLSIERYFTGEPPAPAFEQKFLGAMSSQAFTLTEPPNVIGSFSPCDRDSLLNVKTSVRVNNLASPQAVGFIRTTPPWGIEVLELHWKRC